MSQLVLDQGLRDTRSALVRWNGTPGPIVRAWLGWSVGVAAMLLVAVYAIAVFAPPDPMPLAVPGVTHAATLADVGYVLFRNGLVLALHALACVAGFIAGSSLPIVAATRRGISRWVHEKAGPLAIAFVGGATAFSLATRRSSSASGRRASRPSSASARESCCSPSCPTPCRSSRRSSSRSPPG